MDASQALDFTSRATQAAADSAAFYDKSLEETTETLKSYLKGNFNVADNLGILSTETTRNAKATELFGQKYKELDGIQQQEVLLKMFEDANKVSGAMGQAARESDGFENVMGNLNQAWTDFKVLVGGPLLQPVVAGLQLATKWLQGLGDKFKEFEPKITLFKEVVVSAYDVIFGSMSIKDNVDLLVKLGMDEATANKIMTTASQIGAVITSFYDIIFGSQSVKDNVDFMTSLGINEQTATSIAEIAESIRISFDNVWTVLTEVTSMIGDFVSEMLGVAGSEENVNGVLSVFEEVTKFVEDATGSVKNFVKWFKNGGTDVDIFKSSVVGLTGAWTAYKVVTGVIKGIEAARNIVLGISNGLMIARFVQTGALTAAEGAHAAATVAGTGAMAAFNAVMALNPITIVIIALTALIGALIWFFTQTETGKQIWQDFMDFLTNVWESIATNAPLIWQAVVDFFVNLWDGIKAKAEEIWNGLVTWLTEKWNGISATATEVFSAVSSFFSGIWQSISDTVSNKWNEIVAFLTGLWDGIKTKAEEIFNGIKDNVSNVFTETKETVTRIWNEIKEAIGTAIDKAREAVKTSIDKMKKLFDFKWSLPKPSFPKFTVSGGKAPWGFMGEGSLPSIGISWHAKGGIMSSPTLFGFDGKNFHAGGEAGDEAILPLNDKTLRPIGQQIADSAGLNRHDTTIFFERIIELLEQLLDKSTDLYIDREKISQIIYDEFGIIARREA